MRLRKHISETTYTIDFKKEQRFSDPKGNSPIHRHPYGGLPEGGGFGASTEYEVGHSMFCEAAHCILGSLSRVVSSRHGISYEEDHIEEEYGLMEKALKEYSRSIYNDQLTKRGLSDEYVRETIETIPLKAEKLENLARKLRTDLLQKMEKNEVRDLAEQTYSTVITFCSGAKKISERNMDWFNVFQRSDVREQMAELRKKIFLLFQS